MPLNPGSRIGPYEVTAPIGIGGMGEVYRATDTKLKRQVAIKILPPSWDGDADRLARFQREAEVLAALNHPNIAAIYGLEEAALVMELVEGEDLSQRLARGALAVDEALPIATQIVDALEAAHEHGIVHRDLKPANIKVRDDGVVKVLDFGLAKLVQPTGPGEAGKSAIAALSQAPTITTPAMTQVGTILGTAAYMSPEQAKGREADRRSDVWAFGCVLYEMLTGARVFAGEDVSDTLAAVLRAEPDWAALPGATPAGVRRLLRRCLQKDRRRRLADIADARFELEDRSVDPVPSSEPSTATRSAQRSARLAWSAASLGLVGVLGLAAAMYSQPTPTAAPTFRFSLALPDGWSLATGTRLGGVATGPLAVSPDGRHVAILARSANGRDRLWVRSLDAPAARELPGTDGAFGPFWSPDSKSLGFFADGKLKRLDLAGGPSITLCDTSTFNSASWGRNGVIIFALGLGSGGANPIKRVSDSGGAVTDASVLMQGETSNHLRPVFLPDSRHFLYRVNSGPTAGYYVTELDSTERTRVLGPDVGNVAFGQGRLLFLRETTLLAQPFDMGQLALTGEAVPIAEQVGRYGVSGVGAFSASDTVLAYYTATETAGSRLVWHARDGTRMGAVAERMYYGDLNLSPDGKQAIVSDGESSRDIWLIDLARGLRTRFTFNPADDRQPVWLPDGRVVFSSERSGQRDLYQKASNLSGTEDLLYGGPQAEAPLSVPGDGRFLLYSVGGRATTNFDLWILPLTGSAKPYAWLQSPFNEREGNFSPDAQWIAYTSNESGAEEVYVAPFPGPGGKRQISTSGGSEPRWRRDGKEIYFLDADERLTAVPVNATAGGLDLGTPQPLFVVRRGGERRVYDVSPDGKRFLVNVLDEQAVAAPVNVVVNWAAGQGR